jgi:hypothetical protein
MPDFTTPDISKSVGRPAGRFLSVSSDDNDVNISTGMIETFGLTHGDRLILAFDDDRRPWVAFLDHDPEDTEDAPGARIGVCRYDKSVSAHTYSSRLQMHLKQYAPDGPDEGRGRLYLNGDTAETTIDGHDVTLHRLTPEYDPSE